MSHPTVRPMYRAIKIYGLYEVILDGRYVHAPSVGYASKWSSLPEAEKAFVSIVAGTVMEAESNPQLALESALRLAVVNTEYDLEFYLDHIELLKKKLGL